MPSMILALFIFISSGIVHADVSGSVVSFSSPAGLNEKCVIIDHVPGGVYSKKDLEKEQKFCSLNFYNNSVALCPKTWSTSPGTIVNDMTGLGRSSQEVEARSCDGKRKTLKSLAKFKQSMNQEGTSSTFSLSPIIYYHLSRYFDSVINIPPAVYRTMDKDAHYDRVSSHANSSHQMNRIGWEYLTRAELNPASYSPMEDLFTADRKQIFGVLYKDSGETYGPEINGTADESAGYIEQNQKIQATPAFMALQIDQPLSSAIPTGISQALQDPILANIFAGRSPSQVQMVLWMQELSEMSILDYILSQEDRATNINFKWVWLYKETSGEVQSREADSKLPLTEKNKIAVPTDLAPFHPLLVQKTEIGDNDAGVKRSYGNFTKRTGILRKIFHLNSKTYKSLFYLASDLTAKGPLYQYFQNTFGLNLKDFAQFVQNTKEAAQIFIDACENKSLRFDLIPYKKVLNNDFSFETPACRNP